MQNQVVLPVFNFFLIVLFGECVVLTTLNTEFPVHASASYITSRDEFFLQRYPCISHFRLFRHFIFDCPLIIQLKMLLVEKC